MRSYYQYLIMPAEIRIDYRVIISIRKTLQKFVIRIYAIRLNLLNLLELLDEYQTIIENGKNHQQPRSSASS